MLKRIKKIFIKSEPKIEPKIEVTNNKVVISNIDFTKPIDEHMKKHLELLGITFTDNDGEKIQELDLK